MPWGFPWSLDDPRSRDDEAWSFRCVACRAELFRYSPHCPQCGAKHPREGRAFGTSGRRYRRAWRPEEVRRELERCRGWTAEAGTFHISHRELEVHTWSDGDEWALIYCAATERIEVTPGRWRCGFELAASEDAEGRLFTLTDGAAQLRVACRVLGVYVPAEPSEAEPGAAPDPAGT
jgi:hypothetical protein